MEVWIFSWFTINVLSGIVAVLGDNSETSTCRAEQVAVYYHGYVCVLTEAGVNSIPGNSTALRMVSTQTSRHERRNLTLPALRNLTTLEYDVTHGGNSSGRPFVNLRGLKRLQLFHAVSRSDDFQFVIKEGLFDGVLELEQLILTDLGIEDLPIGCFDGLNKLRILELNQNRLSRIERRTFSACCHGLRVLTLSANKIADLTLVSWHTLSGLQNLDLSRNWISSLKANIFSGLVNVTSIDLTRNKLVTIDPFTFSGLDRLQELYLNDNHLNFSNTHSPGDGIGAKRGSFLGLTSLQTLEMRKNRISCVFPESFDGLDSLRRLDLSGNRIQNLSVQSFECLLNLTDLDLHENYLTTLQDQFSGLFRRLSHADISFNPWHCDCELHWLTARLHNAISDPSRLEVISLEDTKCSTPFNDVTLTQAFEYNALECEEGSLTLSPEELVEKSRKRTENTISAYQESDMSLLPTRSTLEQKIFEARTPSFGDQQTTPTFNAMTTVEEFNGISTIARTINRCITKSQDVDLVSEYITSQETKSIPDVTSTKTPQTMLYSVTEHINIFDNPSVTEFIDMDKMKTFDTLLTSVTNNLKTLDSLLLTAAENIRMLNTLLVTTIDDIKESKVQNTRDESPPPSDNSRSSSATTAQRPSITSLSTTLLIVCALRTGY